MGPDLDARQLLGAGTAALYDWSGSRYHFPVMTKVPNGFPLRKPVATEKKLRQMYLNSDTVCGKLLISSSGEAARQKRLAALRRELDRRTAAPPAPPSAVAVPSSYAFAPTGELSPPSRAGSRRGERSSRLSASPERADRPWAPPTSAFGQKPTIPPINSAQGLTIVKKVLRRGTGDGDDRLQLQSQVDVYLPRAVQQQRRRPQQKRDESDESSEDSDEDGRSIQPSAIARKSGGSRERRAIGADVSSTTSSERPTTATW